MVTNHYQQPVIVWEHLSHSMDFHPSVSKANMAVNSIYWANEIAGLKDSCKSTLFKQIEQVAISIHGYDVHIRR